MSRDWRAWHEDYADPGSPLSRRLARVQEVLRECLTPGCTVLSMCAGEGRDVLPLLPEGARAVLVELDPVLAHRARAAAPAGTTVTTGDAGVTTPYAEVVPADVVLAVGVFGNVPDADVRRQSRPSRPSYALGER